MHFDLFTIMAMVFIILLALTGMSRSVIILAHEQTLGRLLNTPYDDMKYCTKKPMLFRNSWGVIRNTLANQDQGVYTSVDEVLGVVDKEIRIEIKEADADPLTKHLIPLLKESLDQLTLYRDLVQRRLAANPMLSDQYSRQRVYRILNI